MVSELLFSKEISHDVCRIFRKQQKNSFHSLLYYENKRRSLLNKRGQQDKIIRMASVKSDMVEEKGGKHDRNMANGKDHN